MMEKIKPTFDALKEEQPFKVPEGYHAQFKASLMAKLPEKTPTIEAPVTFRQRLSPWLYLAASFIGVLLLCRLFLLPMWSGDQESQVDGQHYAGGEEASLEQLMNEEEAFLDYMEYRYADEMLAEAYDSNGG